MSATEQNLSVNQLDEFNFSEYAELISSSNQDIEEYLNVGFDFAVEKAKTIIDNLPSEYPASVFAASIQRFVEIYFSNFTDHTFDLEEECYTFYDNDGDECEITFENLISLFTEHSLLYILYHQDVFNSSEFFFSDLEEENDFWYVEEVICEDERLNYLYRKWVLKSLSVKEREEFYYSFICEACCNAGYIEKHNSGYVFDFNWQCDDYFYFDSDVIENILLSLPAYEIEENFGHINPRDFDV